MIFIDFLMKIAAAGAQTSPKSMKIIGISKKKSRKYVKFMKNEAKTQ